MWKDLTMSEKAALIKVAVANGIITLPEIRQAYNKFAQGGGLNDDDDLTKLGGFTSPTLNVELKQQEVTGEIVAQKPQISAPSENVLNVNNRNTDTETAFRNYLDSPIIKTRLAKQYGSDQVDTKLQEMKDRFNKTSITEGNFGSSYNNKGNIYIDTNATTPWMSNKFAKPITLSHELAHTMYPSNDFDVGKSATYLNKIIPTEEGAKNIYRTEDVGKITDSYEDSTLGHDKQDFEKAAMVYEVREHMRKLGLWDYTSGQKLTPDIWQKYNSIYKRNRLGNYTNDENAVDSLNNLALNTSPVIEEVNYAANGGPIKKSYKDFSTRLSKAWGNDDLSKHNYDYQKYYNDDPDRAGRFDDVDYGYVDKYLGNKKSLGGILYKDGGYKPSSSIKKRISDWEGSSMKTNRSFEAETRDFNASLLKGATSKLSQTQLDGLYSYSYNVGAGNFRKRVNPVLTKYLAGQATIQDVQRSMWASKDNQLRGLAKRRNTERAMLGNYTPIDFSPLSDTTTMIINHYLPETEPIEIPQLQFNDMTDTPKPIELEPSTPYSSSDIDFSDPGSSLVDTLNMIQMIRRPRKINIYT